MKKVYRVFNPYAGTYSDAEDLAEIPQLLAEAAWSAYLTLTHNNPVVEITINADGTQVWRNADGSIAPDPEILRLRTQRLTERFLERPNYSPQPIPHSILGEDNGIP